MNIVYIFADNEKEWNCSEWRCAVPARAINRTRRHTAELISIHDYIENTPAAEAACNSADIIVVQRNLFGPVLSRIQHWKAHDKVVIADFDDAYDLMPSTNPASLFWEKGILVDGEGRPQKMEPPPLTQFKWGLRLVHAATVPSKRLADDWQALTNVHYLPNYIDLQRYEDCVPDSHEGVIIGWGGSISHLQSFTGSGVLAALKRVCQARPQVKVMICGPDRRVFYQLPISKEQKIYSPWVPYTEWAKTLVKFDIGLAPLSGPYDDRRSWIKVLEYMVMKKPWLASDGPAYQELKRYGWLVKNTPGVWERSLLDMVDHLDDYRREAASEAYFFGISQSIDENVYRLIDVYTSILNRVSGEVDQMETGFN
jgi:hypothetical protein